MTDLQTYLAARDALRDHAERCERCTEACVEWAREQHAIATAALAGLGLDVDGQLREVWERERLARVAQETEYLD